MVATRSLRSPSCVLRILPALLLLFLPLTAAEILRINVGGNYYASIGFRSDVTEYLTSKNTARLSLPPSTVKAKGTWRPAYQSYRYALTGNLEYKIPVPPGTYSVALLFAETWRGAFKKGVRQFDVLVNGAVNRAALDVYASVGANAAMYMRINNVKPASGTITLTMARLSNKNNPFLSGFVIFGERASLFIGSRGLTSPYPTQSVSAPASPSSSSAPSSSSTPKVSTPPSSSPTAASDPNCLTGIYAKNDITRQRACCAKVCGKCGGTGCHTFALGNPCCVSNVFAHSKSCDTTMPPCVPSRDLSKPPSTGSPSGSPGGSPSGSPSSPPGSSPSKTPKPSPGALTCKSGVFGFNKWTKAYACCPAACGKCGGRGCAKRVPGTTCCISTIWNARKSCDTNPAPCVPQPKLSPGASTPLPPATLPSSSPSPPTAPTPGDSLCSHSGASKNEFRLNCGAGALPSAAMGPDNTNYVVGFKKGELFALGSGSISAKSGPAPWDKAFLSHRWTLSSVLKYSIPVPDGVFTVKMLFAEIYFTKPGERTFDIYINGVTKTLGLDVVKSAGFMKGLVQTYPNVPSKKGVLEITLIKGVENPMISGIIIQGPGAGEKASGGGCSEESDLDPIDYESGYDHRSHSVPGGPYVATDFDSDGRAQIMFDGTGSHSHYSDPGPPLVTGKISAYKWTWFEVVGGKKIYKSNNNKSGKFTASFPVGVTKVSLEVVDSTGDVASDSTEVIVKDTTEDGAYCYYYNFGDSVGSTIPIGSGLNTFPKPTFGSVRPSVNFGTAAAFADTAFSGNAFAVRCRFFIDIPATGEYSYNIRHNGPFKLYHNGAVISQAGGNGMSATTKRTFARGLKAFQLLYFRPKNVSPLLTMSQGTTPLRAPMLQYDSSSILPVIDRLSKTKSTPSGGENIQIFGSGFINGVSVQFGDVVATNLIASNDKSLQVTVPEGFGWVDVTVSTNAGVSNAIRFLFASSDDEDYERPVLLGQASLFNKDGLTMNTGPVASLTYGPDGRLYMGSVHGTLTALQVNPRYQVEAKCVRTTPKYGGAVRSILGLAFSPFSNALKMYFTSSTLDWKKKSSLSFEDGWTNGKIETILWSNTYMEDNPSKGQVCASGRANLVTGLPVSNHDHGISKLVFLPDGSLLVSVGGFTNGGASYPGSKPPPGSTIKGDALGGVASNPLSAALVSCPWNQVTNIKYDQYVDPEKARIISGTECKLYATGLRNSFGMTVHTNGNLYATDNGPNAGFGDFSTDCVGGKVPAKNQPDSLFLVGRGRYHGHPNLNRKQCIRNPPTRVKPLINLKSATTGIIEYRSNSFGGGIKGNLYISKFASQGDGLLGEVKLKGNGGRDGVDYAPEFRNFSGVSLVEGPRGEMVMSRVWRTEVVIAYPVYRAPELTFMIGVHPKQGPSFGGTKVLISGHNFGESPSAKFGGTPCTNVVSLNDESFTCITPAKGKNEKVTVIVTGRAGVSPTYGSDYWYF